MNEMSELQNKVYKMTKSELQAELGKRGDKVDLIESWLARKLGEPRILEAPTLKELYRYDVMFREFSCSQLASMMRSRGISTRGYNSKFELLRLWFSFIHDLSDDLNDVDFAVLHLNIDPHYLTADEVSFVAKQCRSFPKSYLLASDVCRDKIYQNITGHPFAAGLSAFEEKLEIAQLLTEQRFANAFHCFENFDQLVKLSVEQLAGICKSFGLVPFETDKLSLIRTIILHSTNIVKNPKSFEELQNWMLIVGNGDPTGMTIEELRRFFKANETRDQVLSILNAVRQENEPLAEQIEETVGPVAAIARQTDQELRATLESIPVENVQVDTSRREPMASVLNTENDDNNDAVMIPRIIRFFFENIKEIKQKSLIKLGSRQEIIAVTSSWSLDQLRKFIGLSECRQVGLRLGMKFSAQTSKSEIFDQVILRIQKVLLDEIPLDVVEAIIQRYFSREMKDQMAQAGVPIRNLYVILNIFTVEFLRRILSMTGSKIKKENLVDRVVKFYLDRYQTDLQNEIDGEYILARSIGLDPFSEAAVINDEEVERALMPPQTPLLTQRTGPLKRMIAQVVDTSDEDEESAPKQLAIGPTLAQEMARVVRQEQEVMTEDEDTDVAQELAEIRTLLNERLAIEPPSVDYRNFDEQDALALNTPANLPVAIRRLDGLDLLSDDEDASSLVSDDLDESESRQVVSIRPVTPPIMYAAEQILPREQADELQQIDSPRQFILPQIVEPNQPIYERASVAPQPNILFRPRPPTPPAPPAPIVRLPPAPVVRLLPPAPPAPIVRLPPSAPPAPIVRLPLPAPIATRPPAPAQVARIPQEMDWETLPAKRRSNERGFGEPEIKDLRRRINRPPLSIFNPSSDQVANIPPVEIPATFVPPSVSRVEDSEESEEDDFEEVRDETSQVVVSIPQEEQEEESQALVRFKIFFANQRYTIASSFVDDMTSTEQATIPNRFAQERDYLTRWRQEPPFEDNDVEPMELENYMASLEQLPMQDLVELAARFGIKEGTRNNMIFDVAQVKMPEFDARERIFQKNFANLFPFQLRCIADELHWNSFQPIEQIRNKLQVAARGRAQIVTPPRPVVVTPPRQQIVTPPRQQIVTPPRQQIVTPPRQQIVTPPRPVVVTPPRQQIVTPPRQQIVTPPRPVAVTPRPVAVTPRPVVVTPRQQVVTPPSNSKGFVYSKPQSPLQIVTPPQVVTPPSLRGIVYGKAPQTPPQVVTRPSSSRGIVYGKAPQTPPPQHRIDFSRAQQVKNVEQITVAPKQQVQDVDWDEVFGPYVVL